MTFPYEEFDLSGTHTYPLASRTSKTRIEDFARSVKRGSSFKDWFESLPEILGAKDLRRVVQAVVDARTHERGNIWGLGAHVIKTGVSPVLIELMRRGFVSAVALNGAGIIHDFEIAVCGRTSVDVAVELPRGRFGFAEETGAGLARAVARGLDPGEGEDAGFGVGVGRLLIEEDAPHREHSVCAEAVRLGVTTSVHACLGADIVHMHPACDPEAIGLASYLDFRRVCRFVHGMGAGAWINVGCAVVLPEVYLKAVSVALNLGANLEDSTTANLDMIRQYRAETNVVRRPPGRGISIIGQHEVLLPVLRAALLARLAEAGWEGRTS